MTRIPRHHAVLRRRLGGRAAALTITLITLTVALVGCSDDEKDPDGDPSASTSEAAVVPITAAQAGRIKGGMAKERVLEILGEPLLTQEPFRQFAGGCFYYAMENSLLSDAWQYCFNEDGVSVILSAFSPQQPAPPEDASQARAALLARADSVCQGQNGYLNKMTNRVGDALTEFSAAATQKNLDAAVTQIGRFIKNLETTHETLSAFNPPDDERETLTSYLDALADQVDALTQANQALADRDLEAYDQFGTDFNDIGKEAKTAAQEYGFTTCSAAFWG